MSSMAGEFDGFAKNRRYTFEKGQVWERIEPASLAHVRKTNPKGKITPGLLSNWYMKLHHYDAMAKVRRVE